LQSGDLDWRFSTRGRVISQPAFSRTGIHFFGLQDDIYSLNVEGEQLWSYNPGGNMLGNAIQASDDFVFVSTRNSRLAALESSTGEIV